MYVYMPDSLLLNFWWVLEMCKGFHGMETKKCSCSHVAFHSQVYWSKWLLGFLISSLFFILYKYTL